MRTYILLTSVSLLFPSFVTIAQNANSAKGTSAPPYNRLLAIGDSVTEARQWQYRVGERLGMRVRSHCKGGIGILQMVDGDGAGKAPANYDPDDFGVKELYRLSARDVKDVDLVLLMGFYNERYLLRTGRRGTAQDTSAEPKTFCGLLNYAIRRVKAELTAASNTTARIVLVSPHCYGKYSWSDVDGHEDGPALVAAVREVAEANGLPFVDAYARSGIDRSNWSRYQRSESPFAKDYLTGDGTPNTGVNKPFARLEDAPAAATCKGKFITVRGQSGCYVSDGRQWVAQRMRAPWNADQLHLNKEGYCKLGDAIADELIALGMSKNAPINIDVGRQLFVDDYLVASTQGIVRVYNHPIKEFDRPLIVPETDCERPPDSVYGHRVAPSATLNSGGLWWDPHKKVFRLWYEGCWISKLLYAESKDGVHWTRPDCGLVSGTNILLPDVTFDTWCVYPDYSAADPYANWRLMVSLEGDITDNLLFGATDGVHWQSRGKAGQSGDCTTFFYDPFRGNWIFSLRAYDAKRGRSRRYWASKDFGGETCQWSYPRSKMNVGLATPCMWLKPDERDVPDTTVSSCPAQLYNVDAVAYESIMLGLFKIFYPLPGDNGACVKAGMPKITDLQFAYSRDGFHYDRPDRTGSIKSSRWGSGKWDTGYLSAAGGICVIRDERLWFYYAATRGDATMAFPNGSPKDRHQWRDKGMHFNASIGVASLRRDGFVGLVADGAGEVVTKPVKFAGRHLFVNAECRFGDLAVEVLDADGRVVPGFSAQACQPLVLKDTTKTEIRWRDADLATLAGKPVSFRFKLHCGTFYSFWVSKDASGKSGGYLAAGGPDYPGLRDL